MFSCNSWFLVSCEFPGLPKLERTTKLHETACSRGSLNNAHPGLYAFADSFFVHFQNVCSSAAGTRHSRPVKLKLPSEVSSPIHRLPKPSSVSVLVCPPTNRNPVATGITLPSAGVYRYTVPAALAEKYTLPAASVATATIAPAMRCTAMPQQPALLISVVATGTTESP